MINRFDIRVSFAELTDRAWNHFTKSWFWSIEWVTNKTIFRKAIQSFEQTISFNRFASIFIEDFSSIDATPKSSKSFSTSQPSKTTEKMKRTDMFDQENIESVLAFITAQKWELIVIVTEILRSQSTLPPSSSDENDENSGDNDDFDIHRFASVIRSAKNVEFFDSDYKNVNNLIIVNADRHIFYKDVYVFENRLKDLAKNFTKKQRMRKLVSKCLRDKIFKWYFMKMTKFEKNLFRAAFIEQWINAFIKRFKKRDVAALQALQTERYIMKNVRSERTFRAYVQDIMRHVKTIEFSFLYNQMLIVWNNLNLKFRMQIFESTVNIIFKFFFDFLNSKAIIWAEMTSKRSNINYVNNMSMINKNRQITNKQNQNRERQNRFSQQSVNHDLFSYASWPQNYIFYQFKNFTYQNYQQQYR